MTKPKLLVTGGAGFIGSHVADAALAAGYEVAIFDKVPLEGTLHGIRKDVRLLTGDLRDRGRVFGALGAWAPDYVSHHAALIDSPGSCSNPREHFETNVMGSINLLDACAGVGSVKRIVFASSAAVYGDTGDSEWADEQRLPAPETPYGVGKLAVEQLFTAMYPHSGIGCTILRYPNVYGPRSRHGVVSKFVQAALVGQPLYVQAGPPATGFPSMLGTRRQYVWVGDVARANIVALQNHKIGCDTFNVPGAMFNTNELAHMVLTRLHESRSIMTAAPFQPGDIACSRMLADRFREEIFGVTVPFEEGLDKTIAWWKERL